MKRLPILLLAASCGSQGASPSHGGPDASADALQSDTGSTGPGDTLVAETAIASDATCDAAPATPGSTDPVGSDSYFVAVAGLQNGLCLPRSLPLDGNGQAKCEVFIALSGGASCAAYPGLAVAAPDVAASMHSLGQVDSSLTLCVLEQLPSASAPCGSCASLSNAGWCYLTGAAAGTCHQSIAVSPDGVMPSGAVAFLGCGEGATFVGGGISAASVGAACVPGEEINAPTFAGFDYRDVTLDKTNSACGTGVCLVNHFQGLTACPYGQDSSGNPPAAGTSACKVPGTTTPVLPNDPATHAAVQPQCLDRRASHTVYCSCQCANAAGSTTDGRAYCTCPSGYVCTPVVPAIQSGDRYAGSYCIQSGTAYDPKAGACSAMCDATSSNCP